MAGATESENKEKSKTMPMEFPCKIHLRCVMSRFYCVAVAVTKSYKFPFNEGN